MAVAWDDCLSGPNTDVATIKCLEPLFENVIRSLTALAGLGLFLMLIIGGYNFLFAGGDPKKVEKAKGTISSALIGLVVIVLAYLIIRLIEVFTGAQGLTIFNINIE